MKGPTVTTFLYFKDKNSFKVRTFKVLPSKHFELYNTLYCVTISEGHNIAHEDMRNRYSLVKNKMKMKKPSFEGNLLLTKPAIGVDSLLIFLMMPGLSLLTKLKVNKQITYVVTKTPR